MIVCTRCQLANHLKIINARQRDSQTREVKYVIDGITLGGESAQAVVKVGFSGKRIVITCYLG